jgi:polar amino acid transport system substrate-binding protein
MHREGNRIMFRRTTIGLLLVALAVVAAGCGDDDTNAADTSTTAGNGGRTACEASALPLKEAGTLKVATGEPAFEPWVVDDKPENGKGFESAVIYAVADQLGIAKDKVEWTRTGFDEAVAPGDKAYDLNIQQYSITPERDKVVDFSEGYYTVEQAIVGRKDGPIGDAKSLEDLKDAKLGAAIGTTSLDYIDNFIKPNNDALVFDDNAAAKAAFDANQVDGIVFDLPTAYFITSVEIPDATIIGVLPQQGPAEQLGILFEAGSKLKPCVDQALTTLTDDGKLEELQKQWLNQGGDIPTLTG